LSQKANESFFSAVQIATDYIYEKLGDQLKEILDDLQHHRTKGSTNEKVSYLIIILVVSRLISV